MSITTNEIERDVEASRSRLDSTLSKLQSRLNVPDFVEDLLSTARRSNGGASFYDGALRTVRRNPLPVLLICVGATMLLRGLGKPTSPRNRA